MQEVGRVIKVSGPLIVAEGMRSCKMFDVVRVGEENLIGEIIELRDDRASIQVYEETSGLSTGAKVISTNAPLSVELGPGIIEGIYDGIQRPLNKLVEMTGNRIGRGVEVSAIDHKKKWNFVAKKAVGDDVIGGDIIGVVQETKVVEHRIMVPVGVEGDKIHIFGRAYGRRYSMRDQDCKGRRQSHYVSEVGCENGQTL